jgi:hypothetical protein
VGDCSKFAEHLPASLSIECTASSDKAPTCLLSGIGKLDGGFSVVPETVFGKYVLHIYIKRN